MNGMPHKRVSSVLLRLYKAVLSQSDCSIVQVGELELQSLLKARVRPVNQHYYIMIM